MTYAIALASWLVMLASTILLSRQLVSLGVARSAVGETLLSLVFGPAAPWFWLGALGTATWGGVGLISRRDAVPGFACGAPQPGNAARKAYLFVGQGAAVAAMALQAREWVALTLSQAAPADTFGAAVGLVVALGFWAFLRRAAVRDEDFGRETGAAGGWRRAYFYLTAACGASLLGWGLAGAIRAPIAFVLGVPAEAKATQWLADTLVGALVLGFAWHRAARLVAIADDAATEHNALSRKLILYGGSAMGVLAALAGSFSTLRFILSQVVSAPAASHNGLPLALSVLPVGTAAWLACERILRRDAAAVPEDRTAVVVRRGARYGMAALGLAAFLIGLSELLRIIIGVAVGASSADGASTAASLERFAQAAALALVGAPAWWAFWWAGQSRGHNPGPWADEERRSLPRRIYLYSTMVAGAAAFFFSLGMSVLQIITTRTEAAGAAWFPVSLVGLICAAGHLRVLRNDERAAGGGRLFGVEEGSAEPVAVDPPAAAQAEEASRAPTQPRQPIILVVEGGDGQLGARLVVALAAALPRAVIWPLGLSVTAQAALSAALEGVAPILPTDAPARADLIIGPSDLVLSHASWEQVRTELAAALVASHAHRLLLPPRDPLLRWVAAPHWPDERWVENAVIEAVNLVGDTA